MLFYVMGMLEIGLKQQRIGHAEGACMAELNARNARTKLTNP